MGSMATSDITTSKPDNENVIPKVEPLEETLTPESVSSSPEPESATLPHETHSTSQEPPPIPKRKGGLKPVSFTNDRLAASG